MPRMETSLLLMIGAVFVAAGVVKGVSGLGLPTLSMALLGLTMPPATAATLMVLPSLLTNMAQCAGPHAAALTRRLWPMWLGLALVTVFSPLPDLGDSGTLARLVLGGVLVAYGLWGLARPRLPAFGRHALSAGGVAGVLSGLLTAATGVFVMPLVPYLQSLKLAKDELIQALGLSFMVATLALMLRLGNIAAADLSSQAVGIAIATLSAFIGLGTGSRLRQRLQPAAFQRALYGVFLVLGLLMVGRSL